MSMLERCGAETGVGLDRLVESALWLEQRLGHPIPGLVAKAGPVDVDVYAEAGGLR